MNEVIKLYNDDGCVLKEASSNDYESWSSTRTLGPTERREQYRNLETYNINMNKENIDNQVSEMLEYTAILTNEIIEEAKNYTHEEERMFIRGAAWMLYRLVKNRGQRHVYVPHDMSLDEAIQHCEEVLPLAETSQCAREHIQLKEWLIELRNYRNNNKK